MTALRLIATPLAAWERDGLMAALVKAGLPAGDVGDPHLLFWRFETYEDIPAGFGGLELHAPDALLRSIVTLPQLREIGVGSGIVARLEDEARVHKCRALYLLTNSEADFFARLGYARCEPSDVPEAIRASAQFASLRPADAIAMVKHFG
jgi:N-acetylglutamate synthase-like GNAT family acetyltransferase